MTTQTLIAQWGNSLAIRLPKAYTHHLRLELGDTLVLTADEQGRMVATPQKPKKTLASLVAQMNSENRPNYDEFETAPVGTELW